MHLQTLQKETKIGGCVFVAGWFNLKEETFEVEGDREIAKVLSPMDGIVTNVNDTLRDQPDLANESPYEKGWLFTIEPAKLRKNLKGLYYGQTIILNL